jgi:hypothetical protein
LNRADSRKNKGAAVMADDNGTRAHLLQLMLNDALDSVKALYGEDGLQKVINHMRLTNRTRESNSEIDKFELELTKG